MGQDRIERMLMLAKELNVEVGNRESVEAISRNSKKKQIEIIDVIIYMYPEIFRVLKENE